MNLPSPQHMPNQSYVDFVTEDEVCQGMQEMGYAGPLPRLFDFRCKLISGIWNHIFGILLCCLSAQVTGFDKTKSSFLHLFHTFYFGRRVDYTIFFWTELNELVAAKDGRKAWPYIPFLRFIQLFLAISKRTFPEIHQRPVQNAYSPPRLKYHHQVDNPNGRPMLIPLLLLEVSNQSNEAVATYRTSHYPTMGPQEPRIPTPARSPERGEVRGETSVPVRGDTTQGSSSPPADSKQTISDTRGGDDDDDDDAPRPPTRISRPVHRALPRPKNQVTPHVS